jgi:hypothetical protein
VRLKLRTQLTGLRPVEVVLPRRGSGAMSATTSRLVRCGGSRGPAPALNELPASSADAEAALQVRGAMLLNCFQLTVAADWPQCT